LRSRPASKAAGKITAVDQFGQIRMLQPETALAAHLPADTSIRSYKICIAAGLNSVACGGAKTGSGATRRSEVFGVATWGGVAESRRCLKTKVVRCRIQSPQTGSDDLQFAQPARRFIMLVANWPPRKTKSSGVNRVQE